MPERGEPDLLSKKAWTEAEVRWAGVSSYVEPEKREWVLARKTRGLYLGDPRTGAWMYEVNLDECGTSAGVLDWILVLDFAGVSGLGRNVSGGTWPRLSWGRSVL